MYDIVLKALADPQRRRLLFALTEANPQADSPIAPEDCQLTAPEVERRSVDLHHKHFPMLESAGVVDWNREAHQSKRTELRRAGLYDHRRDTDAKRVHSAVGLLPGPHE